MKAIKILMRKYATLYAYFFEKKFNFVRAQIMATLLPKNSVGAEFGVFKGQFSPYLLKQTNATKLHLIDPWFFLTPQWDWATGNKST